MTYDEIIENLRDHLDLMCYAGITEIPVLRAGRQSQAASQPPVEWVFIEDPEPAFSSASLTEQDKKALAFGIWYAGSKLCFISGETLTDSTVAPFAGSIGTQLELTINWVAGELKLASFNSMARFLCCGSGTSDEKKVDKAYAKFGTRLKKEAEQNRMAIAVLFGPEACGALLGSTDVSRLRGKVHRSGNLLIIPTWGLADLLKAPSLKNKAKREEAMADMKIAIAETGKV